MDILKILEAATTYMLTCLAGVKSSETFLSKASEDLSDAKRTGGSKSGYEPTDPDKWQKAKSKAKAKFDVYPSAYANLWASKEYKRMGGGWRKKKKANSNNNQLQSMADLREWLKEDWVRIDKKDKNGKHPPCGREDADKGDYPKCRPQASAAKMSKKEKESASRRKEIAENKARKDKKPHYVATKVKK